MDVVNRTKPLLEQFATDFASAAPGADAAQEILTILNELETIQASFELLSSTQIGKTVAKFQKIQHDSIATLAKKICETWRAQVAAAMEESKKRKRDLASSTGSTGESKKDTESSTDTTEPDSKRPKLDTAATVSLSSSGSFNASLASTKSSLRNTVQTRLFEGFQKHATAAGGATILNPDDCAISIEEALFQLHSGNEKSKEYADQYRTLYLRLTDAKNQWLRDAILAGAMSAYDLVRMTPQELASPEEKERLRAMEEEIMAKKKIQQKKVTSTAFTCRKCQQSLVHYFQLQTRSADEPMTTFIECLNCGNSWKV